MGRAEEFVPGAAGLDALDRKIADLYRVVLVKTVAAQRGWVKATAEGRRICARSTHAKGLRDCDRAPAARASGQP